MNDKDRHELNSVLNGQKQEIDKLKRRSDELANDQEMDNLVKKSLSLFGKNDIVPSKIEPVLVDVPPPIEWDELVLHHERHLSEENGICQ